MPKIIDEQMRTATRQRILRNQIELERKISSPLDNFTSLRYILLV